MRSFSSIPGLAQGLFASYRVRWLPRSTGHLPSFSRRGAADTTEAQQFPAVRHQADGHHKGMSLFSVRVYNRVTHGSISRDINNKCANATLAQYYHASSTNDNVNAIMLIQNTNVRCALA